MAFTQSIGLFLWIGLTQLFKKFNLKSPWILHWWLLATFSVLNGHVIVRKYIQTAWSKKQ
ncbi:hypothetical protein AWQ24_02465 [Picosynechococcus sp. PCC 8807]|nr:hypothetical protein AWQ23_02515 [Picosynechococcus sp. PCC 73109]ANV89589.1 hypothetical protein AWQ24_02465 [Picosynechococcus sp. PCC 8807]